MSEPSTESVWSASFVTARSHISAFNSHSSQSSSTQIGPRAIAPAPQLGGREYTLTSSQPSFGSATQIEPRVVAYEAALALKEEREAAKLAVKAPTTQRIATLLTRALSEVPDARMIIASTRFPNDTSQNSSIIPLSYKAMNRVTFGVIQQAQDVDLVLHLPLADAYPASDADIKCQIVYDPGSDDCHLLNHTKPQLLLTNFSSSSALQVPVRKQGSYLLQPGMWRISIAGADEDPEEYHLAEFWLLGRQFDVSIQIADNSSHTKRGLEDGAEENVNKKQRRNADLTETAAIQPINPPTIEPPRPVIAATKRTEARDLPPSSVRKISDKAAVPLLDLKDGDTAVIRAPGNRTNKSPSLSAAIGPATYRLQRIEPIAATSSASVFTCQHSVVPERVVAKVLQYKRDSPHASSSLWKTEKTTLEKLKHRNVVSLMAFDGRMLAIYLEPLPQSLYQGLKVNFSQSDISKILRDISSALVYLKTVPIIHNDIKPLNITYEPHRGAVLIDFGLATSTSEWNAGGTPWYLPPDLLTSYSRGSPGDIWALGITTLYLFGVIKYPEKDPKAPGWPMLGLLRNKDAQIVMENWLERVSDARAELSPVNVRTGRKKLEFIVFNMLERDPKLRIDAENIISILDSSPVF